MTHVLKNRRVTAWRTVLGGIFCAACLATIVPAWADDAGISVSGVGVAKGRPTLVEIGARLAGDGELAADANVKYNDLKKKAVAALEALKDPNLSVEFSGPTVGLATDAAAQMRIMQGAGGGDTTKQKVQISEQVRLILKDADKLEPEKLIADVLKVIDTAKDAGLQVGNPPGNYIQMQLGQAGQNGDTIVVFKIPDRSDLEAQAYEKAVADARAKAERIAKLSGVKLGRVAFVQDQGTAQDTNGQQSLLAAIYGEAASTATPPSSKEVESSALTEIPVTVKLTVKFEIEKQ